MQKPPGFLVNGVLKNELTLTDRGLAYGDGLFETILVVDNKCVLWQEHRDRLKVGCARLRLPYVPNDSSLRQKVETLTRSYDCDRLVVKILITRGTGGRGYSPNACQQPTEIIGCYPAPSPNSSVYNSGVDVRILKTPLSNQPLLAGIKHLNRLEQVLASAELRTAEFEGIMCDQYGHLIEGTKSNILYKQNNQWKTPVLNSAGICGVLRQHLLSQAESYGITIEEEHITQAECSSIQAMALINSVFGIVPVRSIEKFELDVNSVLQEIQKPVHKIFPFQAV